jgi:flagellar capping protein FliD
MSEKVFAEIKELTKQKFASDMPDKITATVTSIDKHQDRFGNSLKLGLQAKDGTSLNISYRIPKSLTGKGQLDQLLNSLNKIGVSIEEMQGKTFEWQRMELSGTMKGHPRHYPLRLVKA